MLMPPFLLYRNYCLPRPEDCNTGAGPAATLISQITSPCTLSSIVQIEAEVPCELAPPVQGRADQIAEQNPSSTADELWQNQSFCSADCASFRRVSRCLSVSVFPSFLRTAFAGMLRARARTRDTRLSQKSVIRHNKLPSAAAALGRLRAAAPCFSAFAAQLRPLLRPASATWPTRPIPTVVLAQTSAGIRTTLARVRRQCFRHGVSA